MDGDGETMATNRTEEEIEREAEENRKEALLASTQSLQPNFNRSNLTHKQISKLQQVLSQVLKEAGYTSDSFLTLEDFVKVFGSSGPEMDVEIPVD